MKYKDLILLTGAGFTKNFNGFLGKDMWSMIFNDYRIQNCPKIKNLLLENFDFEAVYSEVVNGKGFDDNEKQIMKTVIEEVYKKLDDAVRGWVFNTENPTALNIYGLGDLLNLFNGNGEERGLFFTLNQDLLMERQKNYFAAGSPRFAHDFYFPNGREFQSSFFVKLPAENADLLLKKDIQSHNGLVYIKLHGSYGWRSADGSNQMVIGKNKEVNIEMEPLLKCYFDLFKEVIADGSKKLLIIGYGFRDMHINKILAEGVEKFGLKIYVITTASPEDFRANFERDGHYYALPIMNGLCGYFPYTLREIFPPDQSKSVHFDEIKKRLLG